MSSRSRSATRSCRARRSCWAPRALPVSSCSRSARSARSAWTCCSAAAQSAIPLGDRITQLVGRPRASPSSRSSRSTSRGQLGRLPPRALGGRLRPGPGAPRPSGLRIRATARSSRTSGPGASAAISTSPIGSGTITPPSWRKVRPGQHRAPARPGPRSSSARCRAPRRSARAARAWPGIADARPSVSTTSVGCPRSSGRRRRHRPVTRTVTLRPPSATHSTASIPSEEGRSVIGADGKARADGKACARNRLFVAGPDGARATTPPTITPPATAAMASLCPPLGVAPAQVQLDALPDHESKELVTHDRKLPVSRDRAVARPSATAGTTAR